MLRLKSMISFTDRGLFVIESINLKVIIIPPIARKALQMIDVVL